MIINKKTCIALCKKPIWKPKLRCVRNIGDLNHSIKNVNSNVRNPFERLVAEQLTIKATEKKNCNRKDASTLSPTWIPLLPSLLT